MNFIGLMFVTWWIVFFLHFVIGNIIKIFYRMDGADEIKIRFK
jgi:hypothetical protein